MKKHIITIAGKPGSGKSSTAKLVASTLNYRHFSSGDMMRSLGEGRGLDVFATNLANEEDRTLDNIVDGALKKLGETEDKLVVDSRMAWHWIPESFKVYLDLDLQIAAERIIKNTDEFRRRHEDIPENAAEYAIKLQGRLDSEARRYQKYYNTNPYELSNYNLVINTATAPLEEVTQLILDSYERWLAESE